MDYLQLTDFELSSKILRIIYSDILDSYDMHVLDCCEEAPSLAVAMGHPIDVFEFDINNPSDIMPLMIEHKISLIFIGSEVGYMACSDSTFETICMSPDGSDNGVSAHSSLNETFEQNPYRAIAICFLKMQEAKA